MSKDLIVRGSVTVEFEMLSDRLSKEELINYIKAQMIVHLKEEWGWQKSRCWPVLDSFKFSVIEEDEVLNEVLSGEICVTVEKFFTEHGKPLAAHSHIKVVNSELIWVLAESLNGVLELESYRIIEELIYKFTNKKDLYNDNIKGLVEYLLKNLV